MTEDKKWKLPVLKFEELAARYAGGTHDVDGTAARLKNLATGCKAEMLVLFEDPATKLRAVLCAGPECNIKDIKDVTDMVLQGTREAVAYCAV